MTIWPSRKKAKNDEGMLDSLLVAIEGMAERSQVKELQAIRNDLRSLIEDLDTLIVAIGKGGKALGLGQKAGVTEALTHLKGKAGAKPPQGRKAVASIAQHILEREATR